MNFSAAARYQMESGKPKAALLLEMQFASDPIYLWEGAGNLQTLDGKVWRGAGGLGSIEGLSQSINGVAPERRLRLSGVDPDFALKAKSEAAEYFNRPDRVFLQFFTDDWQCLDHPYALAMDRMSGMQVSFQGTDDGRVYEVAITAETPFAVRRRAPFGYLTDRDQQLRHPGDRGLERVAGIDNKNITFPAY